MEKSNIHDILRDRSSCRKYNPDAIVEDVYIQLIRWAIERTPYASGGPRMECFVVSDKSVRSKLKEACMGQQYVEDASYSFVFCGKDVGVKLREGFSKFVFDCSFACSHAHLMATACGLGSCVIGNFVPEKVQEILKTDLRPTLILIVGVPL